MKPFILQVAMNCIAARNTTGFGLGGVVVADPLHMFPRSLPPKEIVNPEQRLDDEHS